MGFSQDKAEIVHKELSYEVMAAVFDVHNTLGSGFLEKVYEKALVHELTERKIPVEVQKEIVVYYKGREVGIYFADLLVDGQLILELKSVVMLTRLHEAQILNCLKATGMKLGLLVNFGQDRVEYKRLVL